jgi:hypothetical protein
VVRRNWWRYFSLALSFVVLAGLTMVWPPAWISADTCRGFLAGVYATGFAAFVLHSLTVDGSHLRRMGAEAERWTADALRKIPGWWFIDAVEFGDRDIDHVGVGPGYVLAVETKWTSKPVRITDQGVFGMWSDPVAQAQRSADRTRRFLRSKGVDASDANVVPLLVLWGPGVPKIDGGYQRVGAVRVVVGGQARLWRRRLTLLDAGPPLAGAREALEEYVTHFRPVRT